MTDLTEHITDAITANADSYNEYVKSISSTMSTFDKIKLNLLNERTVAHFFDIKIQLKIQSEMESIGAAKQCTLISECYMRCLITPEEASKAESEISIPQNASLAKYISARKHDIFIPDTVIIDDIKGVESLYCIEYKVDSDFSYYKLAIDFLKYKYYSSSLTCRTVFIYVLFYKTLKGEIQIKETAQLKEGYSEDSYYKDKSIFIFDSQTTATVNNQNLVTTETIKIVDILDDTISDIEKQKSPTAKSEFEQTATMANNVFYKNKDCFKNRVIYAKIIQSNYAAIYKIFQHLKDNGSDLKYNKESSYPSEINDLASMTFSDDNCEELARHFNYHIKIMLQDDIRKVPETLNYNKKRSVWILILLKKFARDNGREDIAKELHVGISEKDASEYEELLEGAYKNTGENLNSLCLGLLCFIVNLYPIIFDISQSQKVLNFKNGYKELENDKRLGKFTKKLIASLHITELNTASARSSSFQLKLLEAILDKYI